MEKEYGRWRNVTSNDQKENGESEREEGDERKEYDRADGLNAEINGEDINQKLKYGEAERMAAS